MPETVAAIRRLSTEDFPVVQLIYQQGINTKNATFENHVPAWEEWDAKFIKTPRLVFTDQGRVVGWAMLLRVSAREVYAGVCEVSLYVYRDFRGKGIGKALLKELIIQSEQENIWTLQAGIFPENKKSIKLHLECGFRQVGYREKIGKMQGVWRDTILLERRSKVTGI